MIYRPSFEDPQSTWIYRSETEKKKFKVSFYRMLSVCVYLQNLKRNSLHLTKRREIHDLKWRIAKIFLVNELTIYFSYEIESEKMIKR